MIKFARAAGYDEVDVKDFKTQTREFIKNNVRGSFYRNSSVKALVAELTNLHSKTDK